MRAENPRADETFEPDAAVETLRRAALEAGREACRVFVVARADAKAFAESARGAIEADGVAWHQAKAPGAGPLDAARALVKGVVPPRGARHHGPAALARATWNAIAASESPAIFVLLDAQRCDERTARFWWALARRLARPGFATPAVLVAVTDPAAAVPGSPWARLETGLATLLGAQRIAAEAGAAPAAARRAPAESHPALVRVAASLIAGRPTRAVAAIEAAERAAERDDDLAADACASISSALVAAVTGDPEAGTRLADARAAAEVAGSRSLAAAAWSASALAHWLEGNLSRALEDAGRATESLDGVARAFVLALSAHVAFRTGDVDRAEALAEELSRCPGKRAAALSVWIRALLEAPAALPAAAEGLARWPLAAARAWLDAGNLDRARTALSMAGARALVGRLDQMRAPGLVSQGRAVSSGGAPETIDALGTLAAAATRDEVATSALDAALGMVPSRGGAAHAGTGAAMRTVTVRGRAALVSAHDGARLSIPVRSPRAGVESGRIVLERLDGDPPFSRDERRLVEAIATFSGAAFDRCATAEPAPPGASEAPPLDDRLAEVERATLMDALAAHGGNLSRAARALRLSRNGLKMKLSRHGLR